MLISGAAIADGLAGLGHKITRADISPDDTSALDHKGIDVVFIALHGSFGESGEVQKICEDRHLRYTGSPPRASAIAMEKAAAKEVFRKVGLAVAPSRVITSVHPSDSAKVALAEMGLPVVLKPVDGGSSLDVTIAKNSASAEEALFALLRKYGRALVEKFIRGREFTVSILGERALPTIEVIPEREFYDYTAKYADNAGTRYVFDHGLPRKMAEAMQSAALVAHRYAGLSRHVAGGLHPAC